MKILFQVTLLFFHLSFFAQTDNTTLYLPINENPKGFNYQKIDSLARTITYRNDLKLLTSELTRNYSSEFEKTRAIFIWISHNIGYDYKFINKKKKTKHPKCRKEDNCDLKWAKWEDDYLTKVLSKKIAICDGYARLFKRMCDYAGIQNSIVSGYTKNEPHHVGKMGELNHAWNVVLIDGNYYYLDATWAAGYCIEKEDKKLEKFVYRYNDFYWLTPLDKLSRNHFPKDSIWVKHTPYKVAKENYKNTAFIKSSEMPYLDILSPNSGIVTAKVGDTIRFIINYRKNVYRFQTNTNIKSNPKPWRMTKKNKIWDEDLMKKQKYVDFKNDGDIYTFKYVVDDKRLRHIDLLFEYITILRFNVKVIK